MRVHQPKRHDDEKKTRRVSIECAARTHEMNHQAAQTRSDESRAFPEDRIPRDSVGQGQGGHEGRKKSLARRAIAGPNGCAEKSYCINMPGGDMIRMVEHAQ